MAGFMMPLPGVGGALFSGGSTGIPQGGPSQGSTSPGGTHSFGGGRNSVMQNLGSPHSGLRSTITSGDSLSRLGNNYGKGHSMSLTGGHSKDPNAALRGGTGQMRRIRGGLGPGKVGQAGTSQDYSMSSPDTE